MGRWSAALSLALLGCDPAEQVYAPTYYADVKPIVDGRCTGCHHETGPAPFALTTYDEVKAHADLVATVTGERRMPPWGAEDDPEFLADPSLTDAQIATIAAWAEAGAPMGDAGSEGEPLPGVGEVLEDVDLTLSMAEPYTPLMEPDEYRCFVLDWPETEQSFVTGFRVVPGNSAIVHHVAAFLMSPDNLMGDVLFEFLEEWDNADEAYGYSCFGGPSITPNPDEIEVPAQQIAQWVPGGGDLPFPEGTGISVLPGSKIVLQLHYNTEGNARRDGDGSDQTSIEMAVASEVDRLAAFAPWLDPNWTMGEMLIPAGMSDVTHKEIGDPRDFFSAFVGDINMDDGFAMHGLMVHMHRLGVEGFVALDRADGSQQVLVHLPKYDFGWQLTYRFAEPIVFAEGDELRLECTWDNAESAVDANWGNGTGDEMCVANLYISEP